MAKDASVARPLRADWSQLLSSVLNISCPPERARYSVQTPAPRDLIQSLRGRNSFRLSTKKRPRLHAVLIVSKNSGLKRSERCRYCFGGVLAGGLVAGAAGLLPGDVPGLTGLGATLPAAGAGTPDCTLKASTIGCVMSTAGPYQITGPRGHCWDVSRIMP